MVDVAGGLCNGGILRTEPRSESRARRRSRAPLLAVVWVAPASSGGVGSERLELPARILV
jgi:hypothetical protein